MYFVSEVLDRHILMVVMRNDEMCDLGKQILELIDQGLSYEEIIRELAPEETSDDQTKKAKGRSATKVSSTTISRVKACYNNPDGGYRTALGRLKGDV